MMDDKNMQHFHSKYIQTAYLCLGENDACIYVWQKRRNGKIAWKFIAETMDNNDSDCLSFEANWWRCKILFVTNKVVNFPPTLIT